MKIKNIVGFSYTFAIIISLLMMILVESAQGLTVSGNNYQITCSPDDAPIQASGYTQYCSYTWFGNASITRDVMFCFNTQIVRGSVGLYNGTNYNDITGLFKYQFIQSFNKQNCYYVKDATWQVNETKSIMLNYYSQDINPKWDTYFGNRSAHRIDLELDPTFNSTHYEIGTNRSSSYFWMFNNVLNGDLLGTTASVNQFGNYLTTSNNIFNGSISITTTQALPGSNLTAENISINSGTLTNFNAATIHYLEASNVLNITGEIINFAGTGQAGGNGVANSFTTCRQASAGSGSGGGGLGNGNGAGSCGGGGGGGYFATGTAGGSTASAGGAGGSIYGTNQGDDIALGSGGGGGGGDGNQQTGNNAKGGGGAGGGAIYLKANRLIIKDTTIDLSGQQGTSTTIGCGGGGGSGGQLFLVASSCTLTNVTITISGGASRAGAISGNCNVAVASGGAGAAGRLKYTCATQNFTNVTIVTATPFNTTSNYTSYIISSANATSTQINLSNYVSQFQLNTTFSGNAFVNITFDGNMSNAKYINLSNASWIAPSTAVGINNQMRYQLYLLDNATTIRTFQVDFNLSSFFLNLSTYERTSGNKLNYTYTLQGNGLQQNITTNNVTESLLLAGALYNLSINVSNYFPCNYTNILLNQSITLANCTLYSSLLNITALTNSGSGMSNFTVNITDTQSGYFEQNNTSSGVIQFALLLGHNYTLRINNSGYGTGTKTLINSFDSFTFVNSLIVNIFDEITGLRILQNITWNAIDIVNPSKVSGTTVSGSFNVSNLAGDIYDLQLSGANYSLRDYFISSGFNVNIVNAYLLSNGTTILFNIRNPGGNVLPNVNVIMRGFVNGSLVTIQQGLSDVTGKVQFLVQQNTYYDFNFTLAGYLPIFSIYPAVKFTSYDVIMSSTTSGNLISPSAYVTFFPSSFYNGQNVTFSFSFVSPFSSLNNYNYVLNTPTQNFTGSGTTAGGENFTKVFNVPTGSVSYPIYFNYSYFLKSDGNYSEAFTFNSVVLNTNKTLVNMGTNQYGMKVGDRIIWFTLGLILFMGVLYVGGSATIALIGGGFLLWIFTKNEFLGLDGSSPFLIPAFLIIAYLILRAWYNR